VLRRLVPLLSSQFVRAATVAVVVQSGVAFLGLGDPGRVSWGSTLFFANNGNAILTDAWLWWIVPPGVALTVLIVGLAFVGFALEEWADPQLVSHGWRAPVRRRLAPQAPQAHGDDASLAIRGISVDFDGVRCIERGALAGPDTLDKLQRMGATIRSQQIAGALEQILGLSLDYARERVQFGRPIARFQAIQHWFNRLAGATLAAFGIRLIAAD